MARRQRHSHHRGHHEGDGGGREHKEGDSPRQTQVHGQEDASQHVAHVSGAKSGRQAAKINTDQAFGESTDF